MTELCRGLDESLNGRGRLCLVYGEPGIGRTRLCDELATRAAAREVPLFWGRCWEAGGARNLSTMLNGQLTDERAFRADIDRLVAGVKAAQKKAPLARKK